MTDLAYALLGAEPPSEEAAGGLEHVTDHRARGLARLLVQFQHQPRIEALLSAPLVQVQELEDALWSLIAGRALSTAVGAQLDGIGAIVGEERGPLSDTVYRGVLRARIVVNRSDGQGNTLLRIARLITGYHDSANSLTDPTLHLEENFPGQVQVIAGDTLDNPMGGWYSNDIAAITARLIGEGAAGGVRTLFQWSGHPTKFTFAFSDTASPSASDDLGFGDDTDPDIGGHLAAVIE